MSPTELDVHPPENPSDEFKHSHVKKKQPEAQNRTVTVVTFV